MWFVGASYLQSSRWDQFNVYVNVQTVLCFKSRAFWLQSTGMSSNIKVGCRFVQRESSNATQRQVAIVAILHNHSHLITPHDLVTFCISSHTNENTDFAVLSFQPWDKHLYCKGKNETLDQIYVSIYWIFLLACWRKLSFLLRMFVHTYSLSLWPSFRATLIWVKQCILCNSWRSFNAPSVSDTKKALSKIVIELLYHIVSDFVFHEYLY